MNLFVTAIGTDCGKTVVSAILCQALKASYWKPIQTGEEKDADQVKKLVSYPISIYPETHWLSHPVSPHHASSLEGIDVKLEDFTIPDVDGHLVIEGAGGILVPLNAQGHFLIDFIKRNPVEVILVIRLYLGCINHSLLTIQELNRRGMKISGLVFNGNDTFGAVSFIRSYTQLPILLHLEEEKEMDEKTILRYAQQLQLR